MATRTRELDKIDRKILRILQAEGRISFTELGERMTNEYSKLRSEILIRRFRSLADFDARAEDATELLSIITGIYEESARTSVSLNRASE